MKTVLTAVLATVLSGTAIAQTKPVASPTYEELTREYQNEATRVQLLYNSLRDIQEFQDYLKGLDKLRQINEQAAALERAQAAAKPDNKSNPAKK